METVGSPASNLATRDWLEWIILANSTWLSFSTLRRCLSDSLKANFNSMYATSSADNPRNWSTDPNFQPFRCSASRLATFIVIQPAPVPAYIDNPLWCLGRLFREYLENDDRVGVCPIAAFDFADECLITRL
jgi:hypothetical protein